MRFDMRSCIRQTKNRIPLTEAQMRGLVRGVTAQGTERIPDYQLSAWLMAVCLNGLTDDETAVLTAAMRDSGDTLSWEMLDGPVADKHSTGGVGDKTTLILAPIVAACGVFMPKMSGPGLGHTGGSLTPADKILYALRDVTETVDSIPLICASIMSKKLATGADHILLDVKVGSGAFMKTDADAAELARLMLTAAKADGRDCTAVLTDMDRPLGTCIGNALEVREAIEVLQNRGDTELREFCIDMAAELLHMAGKGDAGQCRRTAEAALTDGSALDRLRMMIEGQGGDPQVTEDLSLLPAAACSRVLKADADGWIRHTDSETVGIASVDLGAGRLQKGDPIDPGAGIVLHAKYGAQVRSGDPLMTLYAADETRLDAAERRLAGAVEISAEAPPERPLIHAKYASREMG